MSTRQGVCACCGQEGLLVAHGWTRSCYLRWRRAGRPASGPPPRKTREEIAAGRARRAQETREALAPLIAQARQLRAQGLTHRQISEKIPMSRATIAKYLDGMPAGNAPSGSTSHPAAQQPRPQTVTDAARVRGVYNQRIAARVAAGELAPARGWQNHGACRGQDPTGEMFYGTSIDATTGGSHLGPAFDKATRLCDTCPVRESCLAHALNHPEKHGVWAATTPKQRRGLTRRHKISTRSLRSAA